MERDADFSELEKKTESTSVGSGGESSETGNEPSSGGDLEALRKEVAELNDKYLRALAEFENYKKRAIKERSELLKYQGERILVDLLEVVDNLELAVKHSAADPAKLREGVELIHRKFVDTLGKWEIRSVPAVGLDFDPNRFEAVSRMQVDDMKPGTMVNELRKAYLYKDKVLRIGQVVVAEEIPAAEESGAAEEKKEE